MAVSPVGSLMLPSRLLPVVARAGAVAGALSLWLALGAGGCRDVDDRRVLQVFAASSLTDAFSEAEAVFEAAHPDVDVRVSTAGSQILRLQIEQGARADVFASANRAHLEQLARAGLALAPATLGRNDLVVVLPEGNPAGVRSFADLPAATRVVVGDPASPIGRYTDALLERARAELGEDFAAAVRASIVSREPNVRLVRAKAELGEADAAVVYRTDAVAGRGLRVVDIPRGLAPEVRYEIAPLARSERLELARAFVDFLVHGEGHAVLVEHGFTEGER